MDSLFIKSWLCFVGLLVLVVVGGIKMTAPKQDQSIPLKSSAAPVLNPMISISAGDFIMGSDEGGPNEQPVRTVFLDAYEINQFEITQFQYEEFRKATGHRRALSRYVKNIEQFNDVNQPAIYISWLDAEAFCNWQSKRLPTEAEWEKAAKRTQSQRPSGNFLGAEDGNAYTAGVGLFKMDQSSYGIYDMAGNAQEWVADWYDEFYYKTAPNKNPRGPSTGTVKVLRGGSWNDSSVSGRVSSRMKMVPDYRDVTVGFRCAASLNTSG